MRKNRRDGLVAGSFAMGSIVYTGLMLGLMVRTGTSRFLLFFFAVIGIVMAATTFGVIGKRLEEYWLDVEGLKICTFGWESAMVRRLLKQVRGEKLKKMPVVKSVDNRQELIKRYQEAGKELLIFEAEVKKQRFMEEIKVPPKKENTSQSRPIQRQRILKNTLVADSTDSVQKKICPTEKTELDKKFVPEPTQRQAIKEVKTKEVKAIHTPSEMAANEMEIRHERAKALAEAEIRRLLQRRENPIPPTKEQSRYEQMYEKAETLRKRGALVMAVSLYEECMKYSESGIQCRDRLIKCFLDMGELTKASRLLEQSALRGGTKGQE